MNNTPIDQQTAVATLSSFLIILDRILASKDKRFLDDREVETFRESKILIEELINGLSEVKISDNPGRFISLSDARYLRGAYKRWSQKWWVPNFLDFTALSVGIGHVMELMDFRNRTFNRPEIIQIMPGLTNEKEFKLMMVALADDKTFIFPKEMKTIPSGSTINGDVSDDYRPCPPNTCNDIV